MKTFSITTIAIAMLGVTASGAFAQIAIPDGTKLRVRLDQTISSATADEGQTVELSVTEPVKIGDVTVIGEGARVTGTITQAQEKRRMGRAGHLDFSIDRVRAIDGEWIPLRYTLNKKSGDSHAVRTGVITAGVAAVFWPAAPVFLLMKGKDTTINKGVIFDAFTDENHTLKMAAPANSEPQLQTAAPAAAPSVAKPNQNPSGSASVTITSSITGADIEIDGAFVGSTPTTLQLAAGAHQVSVKSAHSEWTRALQVSPGSVINLNANLSETTLAATGRR
jgi:hypothetical protein